MSRKLSISVELQEPSLSACVEINELVRKVSDSLINFGPEPTSVPHVTIAMGEVREEDELELERAMQELGGDLDPFELQFDRPYRETETGRYVFADVLGSDQFLGWRAAARRRLAHLFVEGARTTDDPHLTLAHVESHQSDVDQLLGRLQAPPGCLVSRLDLALSGSKGRRLAVLSSARLGQ